MAKKIKESTRRWFFDRHGNLMLNVKAIRRRWLSKEEWETIDRMVKERMARGDAEETVH